jgi:Rod binding domain-containing protein
MSGLPPIDQSLLPADVRNGSAVDKKNYATALGFERTLVNELTKAMADTAKPVDGGDEDSSGEPQDAASSMYMQMLPDQLADSITQNGGLGLARTFYNSLKDGSQ